MPDVAVAVVLLDTVDDGLDGVDLVGAHQEEFLLALDEHRVAADHAAEGAFQKKAIGEVVKVGIGRVIEIGKAIDRQELLGGAVANVGAIGVLETAQLCDEGVFDVLLS